MSASLEEYILVPKYTPPIDTKDASKIPKKDPAPDVEKRFSTADLKMVRAVTRPSLYRKRPFQVLICAAYNDTSAVGTALTSVRALKPGDATEWSALAGLFDECQVTALTLHTQLTTQLAPTGAGVDWACAFDPADSTVYSSVVTILPSAWHIGPFRLWPTYNPAVSLGQNMTVVQRNGSYIKWGVKLNKGSTLNPATSAEVVGGSYFATQDSGVIVGYLKPYCPVITGATTSSIGHYVVYHCNFRNRT